MKKQVNLEVAKRYAMAMHLELEDRREQHGARDRQLEAMAKALLKALGGQSGI